MLDWEQFSFDFELTLADLDVVRNIVAIEAAKQAASELVLPPDWRSQLDKLNRVRAVHGTTALEGNPLSEAEVFQQIETLEQTNSEDVRRLSKEQAQIRNSGLAQDWVKNRFQPNTAPLTVEDILRIHHLTTKDSDTHNNIPGRFRTHNVTVGTEEMGGVHRGAPHERVEALMTQYVEFLNSRRLSDQHPVIKALLCHFFLVTIHPFGDGNGRVSRLVEAGMLFQGGYNVHGFYGLSNYFYQHEGEYKTLLQTSRAKRPFDVTPFVLFGLRAFAEELKGITNFIKTKLNRVIYRNMLLQAYNKRTGPRRRIVNSREWNLLTFLIDETEPNDPFSDNPSKQIKLGELKELPYIRSAYRHVTDRTFFRELSRLNEMGFIRFMPQHGEWVIELNFEAIGRY